MAVEVTALEVEEMVIEAQAEVIMAVEVKAAVERAVAETAVVAKAAAAEAAEMAVEMAVWDGWGGQMEEEAREQEGTERVSLAVARVMAAEVRELAVAEIVL